MNTLPFEKRCAVIRCLVDGCSVRATSRISGVAFNSVKKLTCEVAEACLEYQDNVLRNLPCTRLELDEICWCFCYCKEKNVPERLRGEPGVGSMWTWTAMDAETKLIASWRLGARDAATAHAFISDLAERLANRVQLTSDGLKLYLAPIENAFRGNVGYAMLVKQYGADESPERAYSPAKCLGASKEQVEGNPDMDLCSTSFAERQNLNIRMQNRRYTRLTNAFSKKAEMLAYSIGITMMYHNFVRVHKTLKTTPAVAAGIAKHKWKIEDMVGLLPLDVVGKRGPYKKQISN